MKHHLLRSAQVLRNLGKIIGERVVIRGQAQWPGERLKTCVSIRDGVQRADTGVGLGILCNGVSADRTGAQSGLDKRFAFEGTTCNFFVAIISSRVESSRRLRAEDLCL